MLLYKAFGTFHVGGCCRFEPSCSEYAMICFNRFDFFKAIKLVIKRLMNCTPFGKYGYDPAPDYTMEYK